MGAVRRRRTAGARERGATLLAMGHIKTNWSALFAGARANFCLRVAVTVLGAVLVALGIALSKHSCTGTAAISSMPAVLTELCARLDAGWMTMGAWTFVINLAFLFLEMALLRQEFKPIQLLQLPLFLLLSVAVDVWLWALSFVPPTGYPMQLAFLALSILTLGLGISLQMAPDLVMSPADAIIQVIAYVSGRPFPTCKIAVDVTLMISAAALSLLTLGGLYQVREGTIIAALLVGRAVGMWGRTLTPVLDRLIPPAPRVFIAPLIPKDGARRCNADAQVPRTAGPCAEPAEAGAQGAPAR